MFKKVSILLLALVFTLAFVGCSMGGANGDINYQLGITDPIGNTAAPGHETDLNDAFGQPEEWPAIFINGEGLAGSYFLILDNDGEMVNLGESNEYISPTHVPLFLVAQALGAVVAWIEDTNEVTMNGLNGDITFEAGTNEFMVDNESVSLAESSAVIEGAVYVPIIFFRDVYGAAGVAVQSGEVHINVHAPENMNDVSEDANEDPSYDNPYEENDDME